MYFLIVFLAYFYPDLHAQTPQLAPFDLVSSKLVLMELVSKESEAADLKILNSYPEFADCNASSLPISLEEKVPFTGATFRGPFYGVVHDNQASYNTCYANTAKNLLVGTSRGREVASFLDLALLTKDDDELAKGGLAAGESCSVINRIKEMGYCPQSLAILENKSLSQPSVMPLLEEFLTGQAQLAKNNALLSEKLLKQSKLIIAELKKNPDLIIPLPVVRVQIPPARDIKRISRDNPALKEKDVLQDFQVQYREFYPFYVKAVIEGKSRDEIFKIYQLKMSPFIEKYKQLDNLATWKSNFIDDTDYDWSNPKLKKSLKESVAFLKTVFTTSDASQEEFIGSCDNALDSLPFLKGLQPLVKFMQSHEVAPLTLLNENDLMRSPKEIVQLMIAPACSKNENRKFPENNIHCFQGVSTMTLVRNLVKDPEEQTKVLRKRVLASLLQGYALGNSSEGHINTVVGLRFNPESKECELQIRESMSGTSIWQSEKEIYQKTNGLTEVRRK